MNIFILYFALSFYLLSTFAYLLYLVIDKKLVYSIGHKLLLVGFFAHLASLVVRYFEAGYTPITNIHESLSFFSLSIAGFFLLLKNRYRIDILGCILLPVISVMLIWAVFLPTDIRPIPPVLKSFWLPVHTIFSFLGIAVFFTGSFVSIIYLFAERSIKKKRFRSLPARLPPLEILDSINYRCISYGFPLLTVGIITGSVWASFAWGSFWSWDPKETFSLITWIVYAVLLHNRFAIGWRGKKTAYMMIIGFFSILLTFFGVNLFIGGLHSYL